MPLYFPEVSFLFYFFYSAFQILHPWSYFCVGQIKMNHIFSISLHFCKLHSNENDINPSSKQGRIQFFFLVNKSPRICYSCFGQTGIYELIDIMKMNLGDFMEQMNERTFCWHQDQKKVHKWPANQTSPCSSASWALYDYELWLANHIVQAHF